MAAELDTALKDLIFRKCWASNLLKIRLFKVSQLGTKKLKKLESVVSFENLGLCDLILELVSFE